MLTTPSKSKDIGIAVLAFIIALCVMSVCSIARADNYAYVTFEGGGLSSVNLDTGAFTQLGISGETLAGLGMVNSTLFATTYNQGGLYMVNTSNGGLTSVGGFFDATGGFGSTTSGLYAVGGTTGRLSSIDPGTGAATDIGSTGVSGTSWFNLSTNSSALYYAVDGYLYTLDVTSGSTTPVGSITYNGNTVQIGPMVEEGGRLYGIDSNNSIYTLDTSTGAATYVAAISDGMAAYGVAPISAPVPLPSALLFFGPGLAGLAAVRRRFGR